jgi:hypothetical protein
MPHTAVSPPHSLAPAVAAARTAAAPAPQHGDARSVSPVDAVRRVRAERATAARLPRLAGLSATTVVRSAGGRLVALPTSRTA